MTTPEGRGRIGRALRAFRAARTLRVAARTGQAAHGADPLARVLADRMFSRAAGADRIAGNAVRLLRDGPENYPAWLDAIAKATDTIHFENYIIRDDTIGRRFAEALIERARNGITVRVLYDWLGCLSTPGRYWRRLREAGVEVRAFNRLWFDSPFGWVSRNHRKTLIVDSNIGFVAGLCVADAWNGDPARNIPPWRDTGIAIEGPALVDLEAAFAESWSQAGPPIPTPPDPPPPPEPGGAYALRVIATRPTTAGTFRTDLMVASLARRTLWLTDAYFVGITPYVRALCAAAADGVDVRILVPGLSDIPLTQALSRAGFRPLLEGGVRIFEWNGPMLHAKTAVADGRWARIGSSNLNLASWLGNREMDVAIDDPGFAAEMESMFLQDLANATEIVLEGRRVQPATPQPRTQQPRTAPQLDPHHRGSAGRLAASAVGLGSTVTAALTNHRRLGPAEANVMLVGGVALLLLTATALMLPYVLLVPLGLLASWIAVTLIVRAVRLRLSPGTPLAYPPATPSENGPDRA